jgi:exopolyphosphatase/guanosine-5'-triphosphate,3'-diphosphate pyrophosphatase
MAYTRAIIDLGTNTFQLLIASSLEPNSQVKVLINEQRPVQLGMGAMEHGVIQADAIARAEHVLAEFVAISTAHGCSTREITALGTSILRNASNGESILDEWQAEFGFQVELISGIREAELIFGGVVESLPQPWLKPTLLMDIGGGSVEFILFQEQNIHFKTSLELGGLKLKSLFQVDNAFEISIKEVCMAYIREELSPMFKAFDVRPEVLLGAAGAFETMWDIQKAKTNKSIDGVAQSLDLAHFYQAKQDIEKLSREARAHYPGMREFRAGIFPYANLLVDCVLHDLGIQEMWMSMFSLKEGFWFHQRDEDIKKGVIF